MWLFILLFLTALFIIVIDINKKHSKSNDKIDGEFDGNSNYQYKGRGTQDENIQTLINRIDWLAKNSQCKSFYTTSYIMTFVIVLAIIYVPYSYSGYIISAWELILFTIIVFIIIFSVLNLFDFHIDRYNNYYIRQNIEYIRAKLSLEYIDPGLPKTNHIPHRTKVADILNK